MRKRPKWNDVNIFAVLLGEILVEALESAGRTRTGRTYSVNRVKFYLSLEITAD